MEDLLQFQFRETNIVEPGAAVVCHCFVHKCFIMFRIDRILTLVQGPCQDIWNFESSIVATSCVVCLQHLVNSYMLSGDCNT